MKSTHVVFTGVAMASAWLSFATNAPASESRCSIVLLSSSRYHTVTYFAATTTRDTVFAGDGATKPRGAGGHSGNGRPRDVYGQVVRVQNLDGAHVDTLRRTLADSLVVVVPWDYDASCETTYWSQSAQWVTPDVSAFYTAVLRDRAHWSGNRPTFDVHAADQDPYPQAAAFARNARWIAASMNTWLDAREMFSFFQALPRWDDSSDTAVAPLVAWQAAHPDLAGKYPAKEIFASALRQRRSGN